MSAWRAGTTSAWPTGSYSSRYARIWTPRATPRATKAGASASRGPQITPTSWTGRRPERRRHEGNRRGTCALAATGDDRRGRPHRGDSLWLDDDRGHDDPAATDGEHDAPVLDRSGRRPAQPDRVGRLRRQVVGRSVH